MRPGENPGAAWSIESVDKDSRGFEHAAILTDLDAKVRLAVDQAKVVGGDRVELALMRDGEQIEKIVTLGRRSEAEGSSERAERVIEVLDARPGQVIADIGAGSGWLSEAIAKTLGADGLVYAVEIEEGHVRNLRRGSLPNVVPVLSVADDVSLPENSLDTAMMHDVAAHVEEAGRPRFYASVARALKPHGRLVIFDPHGEARSMLDELREYGFVAVGDATEGELDEWLENGIVFRYTGTAGQ
ncbi:MAG: methyltransferase domain-containing protein [Planctomycetes bacterium]|nr:methyltransferase domain-containing protein [Planctomycetota bacterium]